ncbi:MAG: PPC domain-containing protein [Gemmatimonadales bacterium]
MKKLALSLFGAALALSAATTVQAQDQWTTQVRKLLDKAGEVVEGRGYKQSHEPSTGSLAKGDNESLTIELEKGTQYAMIGVCDNDCSDIDMKAFDPDGNEVASDTKDDDVPVLIFDAPQTGKYRVKVMMIKCQTNPCRYGVGTWSKD